ncbi:hypothetical protein [Pedobacter sp. Hv1]|uniref:hypothetical protein n=1 Tax=Pedobacter sp. Hv1 TaxID=1740090 RepID=UPI001910A22B|nr:hypothetical protein [Pedobacter sp. Hv1]
MFRFEPNFDHQPSAAELSEQQYLWGAFIGNLVMQEKLISAHQLGFEERKLSASQEISEGIHIAENQTLGGNMVVLANHIDEATAIGKDCPILAIGGNVEVREILSMD